MARRRKGPDSETANRDADAAALDAAALNGEWAFSRRDFLKVAGVGSAAAVLAEGCGPLFPILVPEFGVTLARPQDLVFLRFEFANLKFQNNLMGQLELVPKGSLGYIIVHFQPQNFLERAFDEGLAFTGSNEPLKPVDVLISGPSRVVLKVPSGSAPVLYTSAGLLEALGRLQMSVVPNAVAPEPPSGLITLPLTVNSPSGARSIMLNVLNATRRRREVVARRLLGTGDGLLEAGASVAAPITPAATVDPNVRPRNPFNGETALELPFRLILSPHASGGWAHNKTAEQSLKNGRHELWHTRLGVRNSTGKVSEKPSYLRAVRAVWTRDKAFDPNVPDLNLGAADHFTPASLVPQDRAEIVHQSSNFLDFASYQPKAIDVDNLMLSTLGGWLDSRADFTLSSPLNLISWQHQAAMGRDYFVQTVRKGRLFPWGHFALKITITERKFRTPDRTAAFLYQRTFIKILEPSRTYSDGWRKSPFETVVVKTLVTPPLSNLPVNPADPTPIRVMGTPFRFKMQAVDRAGNVVNFLANATWAPIVGSSVSNAAGAKALYDGYSVADRTINLEGQRVGFAENNKADDSTYETVDMLIDGDLPGNAPPGVAFPSVPGVGYLPSLKSANMSVEAIRHLVGKNAPTPFEYHLTFLQSGFTAANKGELLFQLLGGTPSLGLNFKKKSDASGGFVAPSLDIIGLSRKTGPISGDPANLAASFADVANNDFDPAKFLKSVDAQLFGIIPLYEIIAPVLSAAGGLDNAPSFVTQTVDAVTGFLNDIGRLTDLLEKLANQYGMQVQNSVQALLDKMDAVADAVNALFSSSGLEDAVDNAKDLIDDLSALLQTFVTVTVDQLPAGVITSERQALKKRVNSIIDVLQTVKDGLTAFATGLELAKNLTVRLEWKAPLKPDPLYFFEPLPDGGFILEVELRGKKVGDKPAGFDIVAGIEKFDVNVFGKGAKLVAIPFERLVFKVESGKKPDVDVVFRGSGVGFDGILAFIETLSKLIPGQGFSDPPAIEVDAEGIRSSFSIPIPSIAVGVFALQNISIGAGFNIPFIGPPLSISFNFCTREEMFVLTVMMIGGGGFVNLKLSPKGLMLLEAAFEARAQLAIDLGVASGSISLAVGVYFRLEQDAMGKQTGELTGYVRIQGRVQVLGGLFAASITLLLELTYEFESGKLKGRATLTIEVTIFFFSISVEIVCERKLAGSSSDPTFVEQMEPYMLDGLPVNPWDDYMNSFLLAA
jgi:hypothetical protein